jgi:anti-anti-sigma factor
METAITTTETIASTGPAVWQWRQPVDIGSSREFHSCAIAKMAPGQYGPLLLDLSEAPYLDACGLQILLAIAIEALARGRIFEIVKASDAILRDLQLSGVAYLMRQE